MNKEFTLKIKELFKLRYKLIIILNVIALSLVAFMSYNKLQPSEDEKIFIFMSGSLNLNNQLTNELIAISEEYGMRDFLAMGYDEKDTYFNQSLQTKGYYGSDLFIFSYELADSYQGMGLYAELDDRYLELSNEYYYDDGKLVGLKISDEYYVFVPAKCEKESELIYQLIKCILSKGGEISE